MSFITQKGATGPLSIIAGGTFQESADASLDTLVGARFDLSDGREVILVKAGATATVEGSLYQDAAIVANHANTAVTAYTAYSVNGNVPASATITLGATAATADQYRGGFAVINAGAGKGQTLRIASHAAAASGGSVEIVFEDGPKTALTTTSKVSLIPAHGKDVVINTTAATNVPTGVALYAITAGSYGFLTSKGLTSALSDVSAPAAGKAIAASAVTAGAISSVTLNSLTSILTGNVIGAAVQAGVSAQNRAVTINL